MDVGQQPPVAGHKGQRVEEGSVCQPTPICTRTRALLSISVTASVFLLCFHCMHIKSSLLTRPPPTVAPAESAPPPRHVTDLHDALHTHTLQSHYTHTHLVTGLYRACSHWKLAPVTGLHRSSSRPPFSTVAPPITSITSRPPSSPHRAARTCGLEVAHIHRCTEHVVFLLVIHCRWWWLSFSTQVEHSNTRRGAPAPAAGAGGYRMQRKAVMQHLATVIR